MLKLEAAQAEFDFLTGQINQLSEFIDEITDEVAKARAYLRIGVFTNARIQLQGIINQELAKINIDDLVKSELKSGTSS